MIPVIYGLSSTSILPSEEQFFKKVKPAGFIIFSRNIESKDQLTQLCSQLKELIEQDEKLILIDQEGGRVQRYKKQSSDGPTLYKPAKYFADLEQKIGLDSALIQTYKQNYKIAKEIKDLGFTTNCTPVADLYYPDSDDIVGDRSFGADPLKVAKFCKQVVKAHNDVGIDSIIKHIPGHGRAKCDSHKKLPLIEATLEDLENTDFIPFNLLKNCKFGMVAHIIYTSLDPIYPASLSKKVIEYIRFKIGFKGKLFTDCIHMSALDSYNFSLKTKMALDAGCDYVIHSSGNIEEMKQVANIF